ncbi:MAG: amidohydrolase, partial [Myxococcales bacterium]|nr:amidohydrolase [Myxococcales bacterium]
MHADLLLRARRVQTLTEGPPADAVAVRAGRVLAVGPWASLRDLGGPATRHVDIDGVLVPGLVDSHAHLMGLGRSLSEIDVVGTPSAAAV